MRQLLVLAVVVAGMSTTAFAQDDAPTRALTPAEQQQLDIDNKGRATQMTATRVFCGAKIGADCGRSA